MPDSRTLERKDHGLASEKLREIFEASCFHCARGTASVQLLEGNLPVHTVTPVLVELEQSVLNAPADEPVTSQGRHEFQGSRGELDPTFTAWKPKDAFRCPD